MRNTEPFGQTSPTWNRCLGGRVVRRGGYMGGVVEIMAKGVEMVSGRGAGKLIEGGWALAVWVPVFFRKFREGGWALAVWVTAFMGGPKQTLL